MRAIVQRVAAAGDSVLSNLNFRCAGAFVILAMAAGTVFVGLSGDVSASIEAEVHAGKRLLADLAAAVRGGAAAFKVPPGAYRLARPLELHGLSVFELDGQGATLIFTSGHARLSLEGATNCTVRNLTLDMDPLPFTQGRIVALHPAIKGVDVRVDEGYARGDAKPGEEGFRCLFYEPDGSRELNVLDAVSAKLEEVAPGVVRIASHRFFEAMRRPLRVGDCAVIGLHGGGGGVMVKNCTGLRMEEVTIHAAGNFAVTECGFAEGGHQYERCRIVRKPGSGRLMVGARDGFHSMTQRRGPALRDCEIAHCFDDLVNIHGFLNLALERTAAGAWLVAGPAGQNLSEGSVVKLYRMPFAEPLGEARVTSCERVPGLTSREVDSRIQKHLAQTCKRLRMRDFFNSQPCEVRLDRDLGLAPYDLVACGDFAGRGAVIEACQFHDGHVRGVLVKSADSVVAKCRFERIARSGVVVNPEVYWMEGPFPDRVRISENVFVDCGFGAVGQADKHAEFAPLMVMSGFGDRLFPPRYSATVNMSGLICSSNRVVGAPGPGIVLMNVTEVALDGNRVSGHWSAPECGPLLDLTRNLPDNAELSETERLVTSRPDCGILLLGVDGVRGADNRAEGGGCAVGLGWSARQVDLR